MDLCVWHLGIRVLVEEGTSRDEVDLKLGYTSIGGFIPAIAANLRREIGRALVDAFGSANVRGGNKAFRLSAVPGSRADTDVVPAVCLHYVRRRGLGLLASVEPFERIEGVVVYATDGTEILNFPQQHHENGKAKRTRTKHRFKKLVRAAKRLRDELVEGGQLRPGQVNHSISSPPKRSSAELRVPIHRPLTTSGNLLAFEPHPLSGVAPRGLDTPYVESLTGYLQQLANAHLVPSAVLFRDTVVPAVQRERLWRRGLADLLREQARAIDSGDRPARIAVECTSGATGRDDLAHCAFLGLVGLQLVQSDGLLVRHKRWCSQCWAKDSEVGDPLYERKLWTLSVVDACPVHSVLLVDCCFACGFRQPPISRDVRPGVCAICGATLGAISIALDDVAGTDAARRLWFARQAAVLVHVVDVVTLYEFAPEVLARAREAGLTALYERVSRHDGSPAVLKTLDGWLKRWRKPKIEALFSVLWQTRWPVARLFPRSVAEVVDPRPESSRSWANSC